MNEEPIDLPAIATPEFAFVVAACVWPGGPAEQERLRQAAGRVEDWQRVTEIVARHRVAGLVAATTSAARLVMGSPAQEAIASWALEDAVKELQLFRTTRQLVDLMQANEIDVRVLKGVVTAIEAYGRLGVRFSNDIDLLVPRENALQASRILEGAGFVRTEPGPLASPEEMRHFMARNKDFIFKHVQSDVIVELHWRLFQNKWIMPLPPILAPAEIVFAGVSLPVLPAELALMFHCAHGGEHGWARLKWVADLGALINQAPERGDLLIAMARDQKMLRLVGPGLIISAKLFGTPLPAGVALMLSNRRRFRWVTRVAWHSLVGEENGVELEEQGFAAARKNLAHYLVSTDPRHWLAELHYDWTDKSRSNDASPRLLAVISKVFGLIMSKGKYGPGSAGR